MKKIVKEIKDKIKPWLDKAVIIFIISIGILWFCVTYFKYQQFAFTAGDTAVAKQAIWNTVHGRFFYQSFLETDTNLREHLNIALGVSLDI